MAPLRVLLFRAAYNLPVTAGVARGVFARHGLDLDLRWTRGSRMTVESLRAGDCDLAVLATDDVVHEIEAHGEDLFMFMGLHGGLLTLVARPGITSTRDLAGRRLGVDDPASGFALVARRILHRSGLGPSDYAIAPVGGHEHRARALLDGDIDATLLTPPFSLQAVARGAVALARAREHLPDYQASAGVTSRRWAAGHEDLLAAYVRAYRESIAWVVEPANREAAISRLMTEFHLAPELALDTWQALVDPADGLFPDARLDVPGIETVLALRVEAGLLAPPTPPASKYCDATYLERAAAPAVGPGPR